MSILKMRQCCKVMVNNSLIQPRGLPARHRRPFHFRVAGPAPCICTSAQVSTRVLQHNPIQSGHRRRPAPPGRWQHDEKVILVDHVATASQLGRVGNDLADPRADQGPVADGVGPHQLADPQRERDVGVLLAYVGASKADVGPAARTGIRRQVASSEGAISRKRSTSVGCTTSRE